MGGVALAGLDWQGQTRGTRSNKQGWSGGSWFTFGILETHLSTMLFPHLVVGRDFAKCF